MTRLLRNCEQFNGSDSEITLQANVLMKLFEDRFEDIIFYQHYRRALLPIVGSFTDLGCLGKGLLLEVRETQHGQIGRFQLDWGISHLHMHQNFLQGTSLKSSRSAVDLCASFLNEIMNEPLSEPFVTPVDLSNESLEEYSRIVKNPLDLGTIQLRLLSGEYSVDNGSALSANFMSDIELVWRNCLAYNAATSDIYNQGKWLQRRCRTMYSALAHACPQIPPFTPPEEATSSADQDENRATVNQGAFTDLAKSVLDLFQGLPSHLDLSDIAQKVEMKSYANRACEVGPGFANELREKLETRMALSETRD